MCIRLRRFFTGFVLTVGAFMLSSAQGQLATQARVSFDQGGTLIRGVNDSDWGHATTNTIVLAGDDLWVRERGTAELEFSSGTYFRMADGSHVEIQSLPPSAAFQVWGGSAYVQRLSGSSGDVSIRTPSCAVSFDADTCARIDVLRDGATIVSVRWGAVMVRADIGASQRVTAKYRVYVDPGLLPSRPVYFDVSNEDDFDVWNRTRTELLVSGASRIPASLSVGAATIGYRELGNYGEWVAIEGRTFWRPTFVAGYVPYRYGHWCYVRDTGHCWVDDYPFGYVTSHYGRWLYYPRYGWVWCYDPVWSPAWVATIRCGDNFLWSPVDFYNRPVITTASATFRIGGVDFSLAATSYVPRDYVYFGGPYVAPIAPAIVRNINVTNISIWNIGADSRASYVRVPYQDKRIDIYNFSPKIVIRGPERLAKSDRNARDLVASLEQVRGTRELKTAAKTREISAQTTLRETSDKSAAPKLRSIRLDKEQRQVKPEKIVREAPVDRRSIQRAEQPARADETAITKPGRAARERGGEEKTVEKEKAGKSSDKTLRSVPQQKAGPRPDRIETRREDIKSKPEKTDKVQSAPPPAERERLKSITQEQAEEKTRRAESAKPRAGTNADRSRELRKMNVDTDAAPAAPRHPSIERQPAKRGPETHKRVEKPRETITPKSDAGTKVKDQPPETAGPPNDSPGGEAKGSKEKAHGRPNEKK